MAEYIKRDAALKALLQVSAPTPSESYIVEKCIEKINRLSMMEVVRCKDCKYLGGNCAMDTYAFEVTEDTFCSYGERKDDNGE